MKTQLVKPSKTSVNKRVQKYSESGALTNAPDPCSLFPSITNINTCVEDIRLRPTLRLLMSIMILWQIGRAHV